MGDDDIFGGTGSDTAVFSGIYADYTISTNTTEVIVQDITAGALDGTDSLVDIEFAQFDDQLIDISNLLA